MSELETLVKPESDATPTRLKDIDTVINNVVLDNAQKPWGEQLTKDDLSNAIADKLFSHFTHLLSEQKTVGPRMDPELDEAIIYTRNKLMHYTKLLGSGLPDPDPTETPSDIAQRMIKEFKEKKPQEYTESA